jgi:hypothetical protein
VVPGNAKCHRCLKGKKGCKFPVEEEEALEGEEDVEEVPAVSKLPVASLKKLISSPLRSLHKRKETDVSPESQKEKAASLSIAVRARRESPSPELPEFGSQVSMPPSSMLSSRSQGLFMPPPSMISSRLPRPVSSSHLKITACASYKLLCANLKKISTLRGTNLQAGSPYTLIKLWSWRSKWVREVLLVASR